jgi:hypothetical protein
MVKVSTTAKSSSRSTSTQQADHAAMEILGDGAEALEDAHFSATAKPVHYFQPQVRIL